MLCIGLLYASLHCNETEWRVFIYLFIVFCAADAERCLSVLVRPYSYVYVVVVGTDYFLFCYTLYSLFRLPLLLTENYRPNGLLFIFARGIFL